MMASGSAVQTKGLGFALVSRRKRLMAAWRSTMPVKTPRLSRRRVSLAKKPSTALSQEAEVGVKMEMEALVPAEPGADFGVLVRGVIVNDQMHFLRRRGLAVDLVEKADELLMPVAAHALADDLAVQDVEGGEQG